MLKKGYYQDEFAFNVSYSISARTRDVSIAASIKVLDEELNNYRIKHSSKYVKENTLIVLQKGLNKK